MGDDVKEDPAVQSKEPVFLAKAGWVKKASGRFLAGYKDRYVHLEKTEIVVYENEDLQTCLERVDLEDYDKCTELKSAFKRKNRLVLVRVPKSGNKIQDVKFQAQSPVEKEAWIKALSDGINRAKNKIFDEVKVDEGSNLDHVTRTRPKGNRQRRPPTRIHMKEVASVSSEGMLRLDLDLEGATLTNGTHNAGTDASDGPQEAVKAPRPPSQASKTAEEEPAARADGEEPQAEEEPQKKALKPPMPPSKVVKPTEDAVDEATTEDSSDKKVLKPPMPPSKEAKPTTPAEEEPAKEADSSEKKVLKPPMPPSKEAKPTKPAEEEPAKEDDSSEKKVLKPPMPPSKEAKPTPSAEEEPAKEADSSDKPMPPSKEAKPSAPPATPEKPIQESSPEEDESTEDGVETLPTPPTKPASGSMDNLTEALPSRQEKPSPPTPPSKDKKPSLDQQLLPSQSDDTTDESKEQKTDNGEEETEKEEVADVKQNGVPETANKMDSSCAISEESLPEVKEQPAATDPSESTTEDRGDAKPSKPSPEEPGSGGGTDAASDQQPQESSQLPTPSVLTPSVPTPSVLTPSVPTPSVPTPSLPTPSLPTASLPTPSVLTPPVLTPPVLTLPVLTPSVPMPEPIRKSPCLRALPKKKPVKIPPPKVAVPVDQPKTRTTEETIVPRPQEKPEAVVPPRVDVPVAPAEEDVNLFAVSKSDVPALVLSLIDQMADSPGASPLFCRSEKKKEREEEKSIDSGQHSDDGSEGSESGDLSAASGAALRSSNAHLEATDVSDDDGETPDSLGRSMDEEPPASTRTRVDSKPESALAKGRLGEDPRPPASMGYLPSEASDRNARPAGEAALADVDAAPEGGVGDIAGEVAQELEKTGELLSSVAQLEGRGLGEGKASELLVEAMEKLKRADQFLREAESLKESKTCERHNQEEQLVIVNNDNNVN